MKSVIGVIVVVILVVLGVSVFRNNADAPGLNNNLGGQTVGSTVSGTLSVDPLQSRAAWTGSKKVVLDYFDRGTIKVKNGQATFANGALTSGTVTFDMTSIAASSTGKGSGETMLTNHLKSADFFDVAKFPESTYSVASTTKVSEDTYMLNGNLTIKGITAPLQATSTVKMVDGNIVIAGDVNVDRTTWNVRYGSEKFFKGLGDNVINDMFKLEFNLVLTTSTSTPSATSTATGTTTAR